MIEKLERLIKDGIGLYNLQDWDNARNTFQEALSLDAESQATNALLGSVLMRLGRHEESADCFAKVAGVNLPDIVPSATSEEVINDWGRVLIELNRPDEAIEIYKKLLAINPNYRYTHINWGRALEKQESNPNRFDEAAKQYELMVEVDPGNTYAWNNWGRMLIELKRYDEAIEKFQKTLEIDKTFKYAHYNWGRALEKKEDSPTRFEDAASQYAAAVNADVLYKEAWHDWGRALFGLKRYEAAIEKFQKTLEIDVNYAPAHVNWGRALENLKDNPNRNKEAATHFEAAVQIDPKYAAAWDDWGRILLNLRRYNEAAEKYQKILEIEPGNNFAYRNWGSALEQQEDNPNRFEEAAKQYAAAVDSDATYIQAWYDWGRMLINLKRYDEAIERFKRITEIDNNYKYAYLYWAWALINKRENPNRYEEAIKVYEKVLEIDDKDVDSYNSIGSALLNLRRYEEAKRMLQKSLALDPALSGDSNAPISIELKAGLASAHHNLAYLHGKMGQYELSHTKWRDALQAYSQIPENERTASDWSFIGLIQAFIFHSLFRGRNAIEAGLERFPGDTELLEPLMDINLEIKDHSSYETPGDLNAIGSAHWKAWEAYQRLESILKKRIAVSQTASDLELLGRIQKSMGDMAEAEKNLDSAIGLDSRSASALNDRAALKARNDRLKDALQDFEATVKLEPHDWGYASNLAEAYRTANRFDEAETAYRKILAIAPAHIDSLIGLGETYAAMGDAAREGSHSADAEMMFKQAVEYYSKVIDFEMRADRKKEGEPHEASKRLKQRELNAMYYSRGYARVSLYDAQSRKSDLLLIQAQNDFRKVTRYEADENYHKAKRAISKVLEKLNPLSPQNIEQRTGPIIISFLAFLLFGVSLFAFFKGKPEYASPGFALNEQSITTLEVTGLPPDVVASLDKLTGKEFATQEGLLAAVELVVGEEAFQSFEPLLLAQPLQEPPELVWKPIEMGYFALMVFGSLIFMVAGLYLQQISKLKFGSIEIEKSSVSQISSSAALGIRK